MSLTVSAIIPSRLAVNPVSRDGNLWLDRALTSAQMMADYAKDLVTGVEFVVGLDPGARLPERFADARVAHGTGGQASALNAAVRASQGEVLLFMEDDDWNSPERLAVQLEWLTAYSDDPFTRGYDLVTCMQREVDEWGNFLRYNEFPTPGGWLMRRETFYLVGLFDETFRWHLDTEWLGRMNASGRRRVHLVPDGYAGGDWLKRVSRNSDVIQTGGITEPLVHRLDNEHGGMATIRRDPVARNQSEGEHMRMIQKWGCIPW